MDVLHRLDERMAQWRPEVARRVESVIREIIALADEEDAKSTSADTRTIDQWPDGFFERTSGAFADTPLVREQPASYDAREDIR